MKLANIQKARSNLIPTKQNNFITPHQGKFFDAKNPNQASDSDSLVISSYKDFTVDSYVKIKIKHIYIFLFGVIFFAMGLMASGFLRNKTNAGALINREPSSRLYESTVTKNGWTHTYRHKEVCNTDSNGQRICVSTSSRE